VKGAKYERSKVPNLYRHTASGIYYARARNSAGRDVRKSLKTTVFNVAKLRVRQEVAKLHSGKQKMLLNGQVTTLGDAAAVYSAKVESDTSLKPSAIDYRLIG
jgi:hypothetical protein